MCDLSRYRVVRVESRIGQTDVIVVGGDDAPVVVLLNGLMGGGLAWEGQLAALGAHFRVLVPELVGPALRESASPPHLTSEDESRWVSDVLDALAVPSASLVGLWRGARLAASFAATAPARVDRLVLLSPAGLLPFSKVLSGMVLPYRRGRVSVTLPIPRRRLRRVSAPALVLVGEREGPRVRGQALARRWRVLPNLIVTGVVPEAGRALHRDQPDAVNAILIDFLQHGEAWQPEDDRPADGPLSASLAPLRNAR